MHQNSRKKAQDASNKWSNADEEEVKLQMLFTIQRFQLGNKEARDE